MSAFNVIRDVLNGKISVSRSSDAVQDGMIGETALDVTKATVIWIEKVLVELVHNTITL